MRPQPIDYHIHNDQCIRGFFNTELSDDRWLSNFHECKILWMNMEFGSTEAAYQASKCINITDARKHIGITPKESKKLSRSLPVRADWKNIKLQIMAQLVFQKFITDYKLGQKLLDTWPKYLEENNYWNDTFWGMCDDKGDNNLGKILMGVRAYLREQEINK